MTVLAADHPYWFLYEGTPGGQLDLQTDTVVRSSGEQSPAGASWAGDLPDEEWVQVADPSSDRSLFVANHQDDAAVDSYFPLDANMTVLGFGRSGIQASMTQVPAQYSIGLAEGVDPAAVLPRINDAMRPTNATTGAAQRRGNPSETLGGETVWFALTSDQRVTAVFSPVATSAAPTIVTGEVDFAKQVIDDSVLETTRRSLPTSPGTVASTSSRPTT